MLELNLNKRNQSRRNKFHLKAFLLTLIVVVIIGATFSIYKTYAFTNNIFKSDGAGGFTALIPHSNDKTSYSSDIDKDLKNGTNVNILLLGYGGAGHDGAYLTDSIMVASINPSKKNISLISLPRDLWVSIPSDAKYSTHGKINSAYEIGVDALNYQGRDDKYKGKEGGGNMAKDVIGNVLGLQIDYYVTIDFDGFKNVIDDLGGVDVNVQNSFDDYYYPSGDKNVDGPDCVAEMNTQTTCRYWHVHFLKGVQHMNGATSLEYVRSRHALGVEGSDFSRSQRQQNLILAVKQKATQIGSITKAFDIMDSLSNNIQTNLTITDTRDLLTTLKGWNLNSIIHDAITDDNFLKSTYSSDGQYILIPRTGQDNYTDIQDYVKNIWTIGDLNNEASKAQIEFNNQTGQINVSSKIDNIFSSLTTPPKILNVTGLKSDTTVIYDYSNGKYPNLLNLISTKLNAKVETKSLPKNTDNVDIEVILGSDFLNN